MWPWCGFKEIQHPPGRYRIIDLECLTRLLGFENLQALQAAHKKWIEASLSAGESERKSEWTESIAVGGKSLVENVKKRLGFKAKGRTIARVKNRCQLPDNITGYGHTDKGERQGDHLSYVEILNTICWNDKS